MDHIQQYVKSFIIYCIIIHCNESNCFAKPGSVLNQKIKNVKKTIVLIILLLNPF